MSDHKEGACQDEVVSGASGTGRQGTPTGSSGVPGQGSGSMNAYDIPRYNSEGYVMGRPDVPNDSTAAGNIQGAPVGSDGQSVGSGHGGSEQAAHGQAMPGAMGHGSMNGAPAGPTMADGGGMSQAGYSVPPQGMAGGQPVYQVPPQGMAYTGMDPTGGQAMAGGQPGYQVPPQGMAYTGMNADGGATMGGGATMPPPPPGMGPVAPGMGYGAPGYYQQPYPGNSQAYTAAAGQAAPGNQAENYGRIAEVVKGIANGEQPDVSKLAALYSGFDTQFWKGALIGAVLTVLLTSDTVKTAVAGTFGGIFGAFSKPSKPTAEAAMDAAED